MGLLTIIGLVFFVLLVVVHEFGHFLIARRNGVEAEEFGIGFPPKVYGRVMGKGIFRTEYSLNLLPIGGFVRLKGENDADKRKGSYGAASLKTKTKIAMAGVVMNWLTAIVIFTILAWVGMPKLLENQFSVAGDTTVIDQQVLISYVEPDSPAERSGLEFADEVISINDKAVTSQDELSNLTESLAGQTVEVVFSRGSEVQKVSAQLNEDNSEQGYLGVAPGELTIQRSTWSAPVVGVGLTAQLSWETLKGLGGLVGNLLTGDAAEAGEQVSGPVGIFRLLQDGSLIGASYVFFIVAIISLTLAVMNSLPIPALDGGRLFVTLLFKAAKKPLTPKLEQAIHGTGMVVLLGLIAVVTVIDVKRFF